MGVKIITHL